MNFAQLIKEARKAHGWSLREAAKHLSTSHVHLWQLENGRHINITIMTAMAFQDVYKLQLPVLWGALRASLNQESLL